MFTDRNPTSTPPPSRKIRLIWLKSPRQLRREGRWPSSWHSRPVYEHIITLGAMVTLGSLIVLLLAGAFYGLGVLLLRVLPISAYLRYVLPIISILLLMVVSWILWKKYHTYQLDQEAIRECGPDLERDIESPLVFGGRPYQLRMLRELQDVPFEPRVFVCQHFFVKLWWRWICIWFVCAIFIAGVSYQGSKSPNWFAIYWFVIGLGPVAVYHILTPIYLRIVPGRLDVIRYPLLGSKPKSVQSFCLSNARITVWLENRWPRPVQAEIILIDGQIVRIPHRGVRNKNELWTAIFQAAISSANPPPLPENELLG